MHRLLAASALAFAAAASAGCASLASGDLATFSDDVAEFFGADLPARHVERLERLHDGTTFAHRPDLPATYDDCFGEIRALADSGYDDWRDASGAVFLLARAATEDDAALHRAEAVRGLASVGAYFAGSEDPAPAKPITGTEVAAALDRLRRIHAEAGKTGRHGDECRALLRRIADFRIPIPGEPGDALLQAGLRQDLRVLRGTLLGVLVESRPDGEEADQTLVNLGAPIARTAVAAALLYDVDPRVRSEAAAALGGLGGERPGGILRNAYGRESDDAVRRRVVIAAGRVAAVAKGSDREGAVQVLLAALDDDDRTARLRARDALRESAGEDLGEAQGPWVEWWARAGAGP
jgi:hypothetical protein